MKKIFTLCVVLCLSYLTMGASTPKHEFRATWLATVSGIDWPKTKATNDATREQQKQELIDILDKMKAGNLNAVCFQVRSLCDAMYQSSYEPWSIALTGTRGKDPGYDPLQFAIDEAHKRGMELHVWVNPFRASTSTLAATDMLWDNAGDWLIKYNNSSFSGYLIDPGYPESRAYVVKVLMEIINKYDVDGLVMDDYFYAYGGTTNQDSVAQALHYRASEVIDVNNNGNKIDDWRRSNVDNVIKAMYDSIQVVKPWVRFGMGPGGIWTTDSKAASAYSISLPSGISGSDIYNVLYCNTVEWIKGGYVDYVNPQIYWSTQVAAQDYDVLCQWWSTSVCEHFSNQLPNQKRVHHFPSLATYKAIQKNDGTYYSGYSDGYVEIQRELDANRKNLSSGYTGAVFYNTTSYLQMSEELAESHFIHTALAPPMEWKVKGNLAAPTNLQLSGTTLSWQHATAERFTVYAYPKGIGVNTATSNPQYLQAVVYDKSFNTSSLGSLDDITIAVYTYDRYGVEHGVALYNADPNATDDPEPEPEPEPEPSNTITWELNGGEVNIKTVEVPTNDGLWEALKEYYQTFYSEYRADQPITAVSIFMTKACAIMTDASSEYKWLGDYIMSVAADQGYTLTDDPNADSMEALWRWHVHSFLNCNQRTAWPGSADFSTAGQPSEWGPAYQIAHGAVLLPTYVTSAFTLPIPTHPQGHDFLGWYDNAEFIGSPLTTISADWTGTLYAKWQEDTPTIDPTWQILYTSTDGNVVEPYKTNVFGANIVSNTYENGVGTITFDGPLMSIGDNAFYACDGLTSITLPNSVISIGNYAFLGCDGLTSITIPNSVTSIGQQAFDNCSNLTSVVWNAKKYSGHSSYDNNPFYDIRFQITSFNFGDSVEYIPADLCSNMSNLLSIIIPNSVTNIGEGAFWKCSGLTSVTIPNSVTTIENDAFSDCDGLATISIPNSVTSIGDYAFFDCSGLTSITIPNSVTSIGEYAFSNCNSLTSLVWNAKSCGDFQEPFDKYDCKITSLTIGENVQDIPELLCSYMGKLTSVVWNVKSYDDFLEYGDSPFNDYNPITSFTFGESVQHIPAYLCSGLDNLTSVTIGSNVTSIGNNAFYGCDALTSITIPNSVTSIGYGAFAYCSEFNTIHVEATEPPILGNGVFNNTPLSKCDIPCGTLAAYQASDWASQVGAFEDPCYIDPTWQILYTSNNDSIVTPYATDVFGANIVSNTYENGVGTITFDGPVMSIGNNAFYECSSLTSITIPNSVMSIGYEAFKYCGSLTSISIPNNVTSFGSYVFDGCSNLTSITIPNNVTSIAEGMFHNCSSLTSITIPNSVISIGFDAFKGCSTLTSIVVPNSVTSIGSYAFWRCSSLTSITIGSSVTSLGQSLFDYCSVLDTIYVEAITPPTSYLTFGLSSSYIIYIPCGTLAAYQASDWANYGANELVERGCLDPTWQITYTSSNDSIVTPYATDVFGANIVSNTYENGVGTITFDGPVTSIGESAFKGCSSLTSITIPNSLTSIGQGAFKNCSVLDTIHLEATTPPTLQDSTVFIGTPSPVCYIPCGTLAAYEASDWANYMGEFVEECPIPIVVKAKVPASWENDDITVWVWTDGAGTEYPTTKEGDWYVYTHTDNTEFNIIFKSGTGWKGNQYQTVDIEGITENTCLKIQSNNTAKATYTIVDCNSTGITYELNGGVTNDYGWINKGDMWTAFCADAGISVGTLDELKAAADPFYTICTPFGTAQCRAILDNAKWDWLEAYIMTVQNADATATQLVADTSSIEWRYAMAAFFLESQRTSWPISADFSIAGTVEAFQKTWQHGFANPTNPTAEFILNAPYREGYTFAGWYTTPDFSGDKVTAINAETTGTLYAKWVEYIPTIAEVWEMEEGVETKISGVVNWVRYGNVFIQDITGGFRVYIPNDSTRLIPEVGTKIIAKGIRGSFAGSPQLNDAVVESSEPATLAEPIVTTLTDLCANPLKYFGQRVSVQGVYVAEYDSYGNIYVAERGGSNKVKGHYMVVDPIAFPVGTNVSITAVASQYDGAFQFEGDIAGIELAPGPKRDTYEYPVRNEKYTLTNDWVISNIEGNFAANKPAPTNSWFVRGMAAKDGIMYFINRETQSLIRVDGATGHMLDPIKITGEHLFEVYDEEMGEWKSGVIYGFNDIKFDQAGNCLIGAMMTGAAECQTFFIYVVDLETGACTKLIEDVLWENPDLDEVQFRFDAFGVYGDIHENACIMAADAQDGWRVYRWLITEGMAGKAEMITVEPTTNNSLFAYASGFGTAPQIFPQDELGELFYVDGSNTLPMLFDGDGWLLDDFINVPTGRHVWNNYGDTISINSGHLNGLIEFQVGEEYFLLMAATYSTHNVPSTFALYKFADENRAFSGMEPLWYFPHNGMGDNTNGYRTAVPSVDIIDNNTAKLYLYVGENGYACYTLNVGDKTAVNEITYELNGGVTNDYGWINKGDMWTAFCADAGVTTLGTLEEVKALGDPYSAICTPLGGSQAQAILDNAKWDWLEAYIMQVQNADAAATALVEGTSSAGWRYALAAFFLESQRTSWPISADFSIAGNVEAFQKTWQHGFANPTNPTEEFILNAPYREGSTFAGWYTTPDFSGKKVTTVNSETTGTLYAKWIEYIPTIAEVRALADNIETKVAGVVNFISVTNMYIQDATGGILVSTNDTIDYRVGDRIVARGVKGIYGGAPEVKNAIIESTEVAELYDVTAFETLTPLIADSIEHKYFAVRVTVTGLKIVAYDPYPIVQDLLGNQVACHMMSINPVQFPIGTKVNVTAVAGWYDGLLFVGDANGIELADGPKKDTYDYPVRAERYTLTNDWIYSNTEGNFAANKPGSNNFVRGMAAKDGIMYFINRENGSLTRVDGATGEMLEPLKITGEHLFERIGENGEWESACTLPFNDIKFDQAGNCLIGSCVSGDGTFQIYEVDLETGAATLVVEERLYDNSDFTDNGYRFDAFGVAGDVTKDGVIMVADGNGSWNVYRWLITDGEVAPAEQITMLLDPEYDQSLFINAAGWSTAPQIFPQDEIGSLFYVDGFNMLPMLFDEGGMLVDDFINCPTQTKVTNKDGEVLSMNHGHNGLVEFQVGDEYFLLMAASNTAVTAAPSTFALYKFANEGRTFDGLEPLWYFPANGMGTSTNGCRTAPVSVEVEGNKAHLYLYTNNNGYARYTLNVGDATSINGVTYELNGGVTNDYGWQSKGAVALELQNDYNAAYGTSKEWAKSENGYIYYKLGEEWVREDLVPAGTDCITAGFIAYVTYNNSDNLKNLFAANPDKYGWLNDIIIATRTAAGLSVDDASMAEIIYRYELSAFFLCSPERTSWPGTSSYEVAGTFESFKTIWKQAFANPTNPAEEFVLNAPYREGYTFAGWYTNADFSGEKVTTVNSETTGTLYAKWIDDTWVIKYTSTDGNIVEPYAIDVFGANIVSNIYENGVGTITFDGPVTSIGGVAFYSCDSLKSIVIPSSVTSIVTGAFDFCHSLDSLVVKDNVFYDSRENCNAIIETATNTLVVGCRKTIIPNNVTSIGNSAFYGRDSLQSIIIPDNVISIGGNAFSYCTSLYSIVIPNSITCLENATFFRCSSLSSIVLPESITTIKDFAFEGCASLTSIELPSGITELGNHVFAACSTLVSIDIPEQVTIIKAGTFASCPKLTSINIPDNITTIERDAFWGCKSITSIVLPNNLTILGGQAFRHCTSLVSITLPNKLQNIGNYAFANCSSLDAIHLEATTPLVLADSTTFVGTPSPTCYIPCGTLAAYQASDWANYVSEFVEDGCIDPTWQILYTSTDGNIVTPNATDVFGANIVSNIYENGVGTITFDAPITSIGEEAFQSCSSLTSITIPNSVTSIGNLAFRGCLCLSSITIPNSVTNIESHAFRECSSLKSITIPSSVTGIGKGAFEGAFENYCGLVSITVDSDNRIYDSRENCNAIIETATNTLVVGCQNTIIPNSVTIIGERAFRGSTFTSITIPSNVTSIEYLAFFECDSLDAIYMEAIIPPTLGNQVFNYEASFSMHIPCGTLDAYQSSDWAQYVSEFVEEGCAPIQMCGDDLYWEYADGVLTITGTGDMYDYAADTDVPWYDVRDNIKTVNLPDAMIKIGQNAFYKCTAMTSINMPTSLTAIGEKAFAQDTKLACEIILPASMTNIASRAFFNCQAVTAFHIEATTPPTIPNDAFERTTAPIHVPCGYGHVYGKHTRWGMLNLEMCELLQDNVYYYPIDGHTARAVTYHSNPTDTIVIQSAVVIDGMPRTVTEVADFAFTDCANLPAIYFNEGLEYIGERAFVRCYGLHGTIVLPATLETIGERAFSYCDNVEKYILQAMTPPALANDVFTGSNSKALFYISCEAMDDYKVATNWSSLKSRLRDACLNIYHYNTALGANGVHTTEDTLVASIYYRRQFTPNSWETLYLPFEVDRVTVLEDGVEYDLIAWNIFGGGHYYLAKPYGIENKEVVFGFTQMVDAHTPYIIQFKDEYYRDKMITFYGSQSWNHLSTSFEALTCSFDMQMSGNTTLQDQTLDQPVYMLRGTSNFILQNTTTTLHPFECYVMPYATSSSAPTRMTVRLRGDVTTAIESMNQEKTNVQKIFLDGQLFIIRDGKIYTTVGQEVK